MNKEGFLNFNIMQRYFNRATEYEYRLQNVHDTICVHYKSEMFPKAFLFQR